MSQPSLYADDPEPPKVVPFPAAPEPLCTAEILTGVCEAIRLDGVSDSIAGQLHGIMPAQLAQWKSQNPALVVFLDQQRALFRQTQLREIRCARNRDGTINWQAQAWLLENAGREDFSKPVPRRARRSAAAEAEPASTEPVITPRELVLLQQRRALVVDKMQAEHEAELAKNSQKPPPDPTKTLQKRPISPESRPDASSETAPEHRADDHLEHPVDPDWLAAQHAALRAA